MNKPLLSFCVIFAFAVGAWGLKSAFDGATGGPSLPVASAELLEPASDAAPAAGNPESMMQAGSSAGAGPSTPSVPTPLQASGSSRISDARAASAIAPQSSVTSAPISPRPAAAAAMPQSGAAASGGNFAATSQAAPRLAGAPTFVSSAPAASTATSAVSPATTGSDASVLEVEPGVPLPAAMLPADGESASPAVAAAREQIVESFVQEVDNALSQPETANSDSAVNNAYFDSLTVANEQYRALYGEAAYGQKTMQASLEALSGK
jgi:hypothetical protein